MDTISKRSRIIGSIGFSLLLILAVLMTVLGPSALSGLAKPSFAEPEELILYSYEVDTQGWSGSVVSNNPGGTVEITTTHATEGVQALQINSLPDQGTSDEADGGFFSVQPSPTLDFSAYTHFKFDVYTPISMTMVVAFQTGGWANWVQSGEIQLQEGQHTVDIDITTINGGNPLPNRERIDAIHFLYRTVGTYVQDYIRVDGYIPPPTNTTTPTLGPTATPMVNLPGLRVVGPDLYDNCGEKILLRGVNKMVIWTDINGNSLPEIAKTGANSVRMVWLPTGDPAQLDALIQRAIDNGLIPMVGMWNTTGDFDELTKALEYWVRPDVVSVIQAHEQYLLVNIGNEAGNVVSEEDFKSTYTYIIRRMRQEGIRTPLVIDANGWGQNIDMLQAAGPYLLSVDPDHNLIFDVHTYWPYKWGWTDERVINEFAETAALGIPFMIGEFGNKWDNDGSEGDEIPYKLIIQEAYRYGFGYYPWEWGPGNNPQTHLNMTDDGTYDTLHDWGLEVAITDPFSILNTSNRPYSILHGGTCESGATATPGPSPTPYNDAPIVNMVGPAFNAMFDVDDNVILVAEASDFDGNINKVEFYVGETLVGEDTTVPFSYTLAVDHAGEYWFSAKAIDDDGAMTLSEATYAIVGVPPFFSINDSITGTSNFQFEYTGTWNVGNKVGRFHDDDHYSSTQGSCFAFRYIGSQVGMYVATAPHHGIAELTIDNGDAITVSLYSETAQDNVLIWESDLLELGNHVVDVCVTGDPDPSGTGSTISIDRMYVSAVNNAPSVRITSPNFGEILPEASDVSLSADASDVDGTINKVKFYINNTLVSEDFSAPYTYTLKSAPIGEYWVYVKAVDDLGAVTATDASYLVVGTPTFLSVNDSITGTENFQFEYQGDWLSDVQNGLFNDDQHISITSGDCYVLRFHGVNVRIYSAFGPDRGIASVTMDDGVVETFDLYDIVSLESILAWESELLQEDDHKLEVCVSGQKNAASTGTMISIDRANLITFDDTPIYLVRMPIIMSNNGTGATPEPTSTRTVRATATPRGISTLTPTASNTPTATNTPTSTLIPPATATIIPPNTRTPYPTSTVPPTPTECVPVADVVVYDDATTWENWSWGTNVDFANTDPVFAGTNSISVTYTGGWSALSLHTGTPISTIGIQYISFYAYGGTDGTLLRVYVHSSAGESDHVDTIIPGGTWTNVTVTMAQLGNPADISRINFQDAGDPDLSTYYLDEIVIVGSDCGACVPVPDVSVYDDATTWDNWSWGTNVDFANADPVYAGTNSISVTYTGGWSAFSLHSGTPISTEGIQYISFYGYGGTGGTSLRFYTQDSSDANSANYDTIIPEGVWTLITITMEQLGNPADISRVNFQDAGDPDLSSYYLDEIMIVGTDCGTCTPVPDVVVYDDATTWDNWSYSTNVDFANTDPVFAGTNSISVTYTGGWGALSLHSGTPISTEGIQAVTFYAYGGTGGTSLRFYTQDSSDNNSANYDTIIPEGVWTLITVTIEQLGNPTEISRVNFQDAGDPDLSTYYLDEITIVGTDCGATCIPALDVVVYDDSTTWDNWSWGTAVDFAETEVVYTGTNAISVTYGGGWVGFSLHTNTPIESAGVQYISFYAYGGTDGTQLRVYTSDSNGTDSSGHLDIIVPAGVWTNITVTLEQLGNPINIARVTIQDAGDPDLSTYYLDEITIVGTNCNVALLGPSHRLPRLLQLLLGK